MKTKILFDFLLLSFSFCLLSCDTNDPPPGNGNKETITISVEDTSPTEVWLNVATKNLQLPNELLLLRNGDTSDVFSLTKNDTLIYDDSLQPSTTYTYQVTPKGTGSNQQPITSNEVTATTMDTTSHNFTWQTFTFGGQGGSSTLYDVAIIDENDIWAVGEIYTADDKYNAVHWDGNDWEFKQLQFFTFCEQSHTGPYPARSILVLSDSEILISSGSQVTFYDGEKQIKTECIPTSVNKMWGTDINNIYAVGAIGNIAYYNGSSWKKIESGTTTHINDIWGLVNNQNQTILYCPVSSFFVPGEKKILKIINNSVETVKWNEDARLYSAWSKNENILYACGEGVFENKFGEWKEIELYAIGTNSIRGNDLNDIVIAGDYGAIFHFNGTSWQLLNSINSSKGYSKVSTLENLVVVCGNQQGQGLIEIGTRN